MRLASYIFYTVLGVCVVSCASLREQHELTVLDAQQFYRILELACWPGLEAQYQGALVDRSEGLRSSPYAFNLWVVTLSPKLEPTGELSELALVLVEVRVLGVIHQGQNISPDQRRRCYKILAGAVTYVVEMSASSPDRDPILPWAELGGKSLFDSLLAAGQKVGSERTMRAQ